jgi:uncharacterized protein YhbP (UPF0306 family)
MTTYAKAAQEIIENNIYMTIATASTDGKPWISPVFFAYDKEYNLFWVSNKNSRHSTLIRSNPQVAIVIFDSKASEGTGDAVYIEAHVIELVNAADLKSAMEAYASRATIDECIPKNIEEVTKDAIWRIYKAVPKKVSKLGGHEYINGQYADKRIEINSLIV